MKIHQIYDKVVSILQEKPICRDSDMYLTFVIYNLLWHKTPTAQETGKDWVEATKEEMFGAIENNQLPTMSSIARARRKAQQSFPELRGDKYQARQEKANLYDKYLNFLKFNKQVQPKKVYSSYHLYVIKLKLNLINNTRRNMFIKTKYSYHYFLIQTVNPSPIGIIFFVTLSSFLR